MSNTVARGQRRALVVCVLEWDHAACAKELVTVLLDDPLSSDAESRTLLKSRWNGQTGIARLLIRNGPQSGFDVAGLSLTSSWLRRTNAEVLEISRRDDSAVLDFLQTDVPIIVLSGLQLHDFPLLDTLRQHPSAHIVVNSPLCVSEHGRSLIISALHDHLGLNTNNLIHLVDTKSATHALEAIRDTRDVLAVQTFQEQYLASRLAPLISALEIESNMSHRDRTARSSIFVAKVSARECEVAVRDALAEVEAIKATAIRLQSQIDSEKQRAIEGALGANGNETVAFEVKKAEARVRDAMHKLRWWQVPINVDDLGYILNRTIDSVWGTELEKRLAFHAGLLQGTKAIFEARALDVVQTLPARYQTQVLSNELDQLRGLPSASIARDTLNAAIHTRRELVGTPAVQLHRRAQRLVLTTCSVSFGTAVVSFIAWAAQHVDGATAAGIVALASIATLRWSIGRWEKAQKAWWADWNRVGEGLARDVQRDYVQALNERVFILPQRLCDRLFESAEHRSKDIVQVEHELTEAKRAADGLNEP